MARPADLVRFEPGSAMIAVDGEYPSVDEPGGIEPVERARAGA